MSLLNLLFQILLLPVDLIASFLNVCYGPRRSKQTWSPYNNVRKIHSTYLREISSKSPIYRELKYGVPPSKLGN
jgi:hypothetical protein